MNRALTWFIRIWVAFAILVNVLSMAGAFMAEGFWGGWATIQDTYSPFNYLNVLMEIILLSPALLAYWWRERRIAKAFKSNA